MRIGFPFGIFVSYVIGYLLFCISQKLKITTIWEELLPNKKQKTN